jgi:pimeloyl-ACP methyl ester carboxylesterase
MSLPISPSGPAGAGRTLGRDGEAGNGEMTFDRRVAGAIEAFEFLGRHLRTDKVLLVAESMGILTTGSLVRRRPDRAVGSGAWNATWSERSEPAAYAEPGPQAALLARGARSYRSDKADRLVGVESAGRPGRGFAAAAAVPRVRANCVENVCPWSSGM